MKISVHVDIKPTDQIIKRIFDDRTGIFLAETWAKIFTKYIFYSKILDFLVNF